LINPRNRANAKSAGQLENNRTVTGQAMTMATVLAIFWLDENRVDRDACWDDVSRGNFPGGEVYFPLLGGGEITLAGLIDPKTVGVEISSYGNMRKMETVFVLKRSNDSGGKKVGAKDQIPRLGGEQVNKGLEIEAFKELTQVIAATAGKPIRFIEPIVHVAQDVRSSTDKVEVGLAVKAAKSDVSQLEDIKITDDGIGTNLA
jgi:hypothetical protein